MSELRNITTKSIAAATAAAAIIMLANTASAKTINVPTGGNNLVLAIDRAAVGDTLRLADGVHRGPVTIDKRLQIIAAGKGAVIRGNDTGSVVTVRAPDVRIDGITVTGSGLLLETQDSGIFLSKEATGAQVLNR